MTDVNQILAEKEINVNELVDRLYEYSDWAFANEYEVPICLGDTLKTAADVIGSLKNTMYEYGRIWYSTHGDVMPDSYSTVLLLIYGCDKTFCGYIDDSGEWYVWNRGLNYGNPMWWSPMPGDKGRGVLS